jgi:hypothetical protein
VHPYGAKQGAVIVAPFGKGVSAAVKAKVRAAYKALRNGKHF